MLAAFSCRCFQVAGWSLACSTLRLAGCRILRDEVMLPVKTSLTILLTVKRYEKSLPVISSHVCNPRVMT